MGTCSAAAARKEQVITEDINTDLHWAGYLDLAARHGLRAGWATPILSSAGQVLGTFSLYWPEPRSPTPQHLEIINQIARLVAFAMERKQAAEALNASKQVARGQVEALIYSLDVLATASEPKKFLGKMLSTICRQKTLLPILVYAVKCGITF
jgi:GAF domain-containing protein